MVERRCSPTLWVLQQQVRGPLAWTGVNAVVKVEVQVNATVKFAV